MYKLVLKNENVPTCPFWATYISCPPLPSWMPPLTSSYQIVYFKSLFSLKLNFKGGLWNMFFGLEPSKSPKLWKKGPFWSQIPPLASSHQIVYFTSLFSSKWNFKWGLWNMFFGLEPSKSPKLWKKGPFWSRIPPLASSHQIDYLKSLLSLKLNFNGCLWNIFFGLEPSKCPKLWSGIKMGPFFTI